MYGIDILVEEHKNILRFTKLMNQLCCQVIDGHEPNVEVFLEGIEFARNYADKHHHGKEEKILFRVMQEKIGPVAEKLIQHGMLVEHDLGRYHITELESALARFKQNPSTEEKLNIITHAAGYADLLKRHIEKEDSVVYSFAERMLTAEDKKLVDEETEGTEQEANEKDVQKYIKWLQDHVK